MTFGTNSSFYTLPGLAPNGAFVGSNGQTGTVADSTKVQYVTVDSTGRLGTSSSVVGLDPRVPGIEDGLRALGQQIQTVGALSAALSALPTTLPADSNGGCGIGTGVYGSAWAGAVGCTGRFSESVTFNLGGAFSSAPASTQYSSAPNFMARFGIFFQF